MTGALRYEWRRISTIRSTWIMSLVAIATTLGIAIIIILVTNAERNSGARPSDDSFLTLAIVTVVFDPVLLVLLGTIAAQAFGQEYRHGTIRLTLTEFPQRLRVFWAKIIICALVLTLVFVVSVVLGAIALYFGPFSHALEFGDSAGIALRGWVFLMLFAAMVFGLTLITRVLALGLVIPLVLFAIEFIFVPLLSTVVPWVQEVLPFNSGFFFVGAEDMLRNGLVYAAWCIVPLVIGAILFKTRDA